MILFIAIVLTFILAILINVFFLKEKHREWLGKHTSWAMYAVLILLIPVVFIHNQTINHICIFLQWCFIAPQGIGVYYNYKKYKKAMKNLDDSLIVLYEEWLATTVDDEEAEHLKIMIDELKNPPTIKKKFQKIWKKVF